MYSELRKAVYQANLALVEHHLVILTWGNASGIDRARGLVAIKPSGVDYTVMRPEDIVIVDLDGHPVDGRLRPSSDLASHLELYHAWPSVGGIVHTHARCSTAYAQACTPIPCFGTTHADHFRGDVPCTRLLTADEVAGDYERNTGRVIVERFQNLDPVAVPGVLVAGHASFTWGPNPHKAVENSVALEQIADMALMTRVIAPDRGPIPDFISDRHFFRKHGCDAYYGQH